MLSSVEIAIGNWKKRKKQKESTLIYVYELYSTVDVAFEFHWFLYSPERLRNSQNFQENML